MADSAEAEAEAGEQLSKKARLEAGAGRTDTHTRAEEPAEEARRRRAAGAERQDCGPGGCYNPESGAAPGAANLPVGHVVNAASEEIVPNGIRSWESDEDDKTSHASSSDWTPRTRIGTGPYSFVQQHLMLGTDPRSILKDLLRGSSPPPDLDDMTLWQIVLNILSEPPKRKKRKDINTLEDVVRILKESKKIMVLTGAGVSVSCGIPDFRSRDGIYARLAVDFPDLPDPHAMFDIEYFRKDPRPFFKFAKEIYPGQFQPSLCHKFIALLDKQERLLRNYTQNIDTLEQVAGIRRIVECHGSFAMASCLMCKYKVDCEAIRKDVFNQVVPQCPRCPPDVPLAIMKPDIVFFGENLPEQFHRSMKYDKDEVDLLIVIGSSLKVRPVALIPNSQYLFLAPNRYIFHGAEVYSDSEGDEASSSGNSDNESCSSRSVGDGEEESDVEEFYHELEEDGRTPYFGTESEHFGDGDVLSESVENPTMQGECEDTNPLE
ncbi:NAD-dependent protein deacetylase sirtuin-1 isoform X5 [Carcharodon carcharias]|uniref:NAD-dependent protein deacetylase sirtuin-1 isoform X5 n=1 Tax=Carcharodon carcharias TaxID=13397 RepID=UPI001B7E7A79|nr:NAD-dependent protein deacetylase sirtuin-1 isoform X5 [Carcharodon carcharias]